MKTYELWKCRVLGFLWAIVLAVPADVVLAAGKEEEKKMEWLLSYFCILLFLILGTLVLMRPTKRSDTVLTSEEQFAERQERLKAAH
ncbi:MAG: hypothetical protein ACRC46_10210 [Thermoguttaceae bacterium]